ncbi:MAG TPA: hypothetical protein VN808_16925 [Stellaceae bacterium]|nr:hypothetical protein [Stellaceae bacterium]
MKTRSNLGLILAAACLTAVAAVATAHAQTAPQLVTNHPQVDPGDYTGSGSADRNVIDSQRYERMLQINATFREQRMSKECGSIDDPNLHEQCLASFR